jgi:sRNA-binding protein
MHLISTLAELFPTTFTAEPWQQHKPLALGIDKHLIEAGVLTAGECRAVFSRYTRRRMYQAALAAGGHRYDLNGAPCDEVSAEHMSGAASALAHMDAKAVESAAKVRVEWKAERKAEKAKAKAEHEAAAIAAEASKGSAPHSEPEIIAPRPPPPVAAPRLGFAGLKRAAQERQAAARVA